MSSAKGKLARMFGGMLLERARVTGAQSVGGFRLLVLRSDVRTPEAGTKLQLLLPSDDMRTYSPIPSAEGFTLLGWTRGSGPGARWMSHATVGDELRFIGPQRSLALPAGPVIIAGDETSVAVAASFEAERPGQVRAVLQANAVDDVRAAAEAVNLHSATVVARTDTESAINAVLEAKAAVPNAVVALTGGSELVLAARAALRARGVRGVKTKPYWIPGKAGLD